MERGGGRRQQEITIPTALLKHMPSWMRTWSVWPTQMQPERRPCLVGVGNNGQQWGPNSFWPPWSRTCLGPSDPVCNQGILGPGGCGSIHVGFRAQGVARGIVSRWCCSLLVQGAVPSHSAPYPGDCTRDQPRNHPPLQTPHAKGQKLECSQFLWGACLVTTFKLRKSTTSCQNLRG